MPPSWVSAAAGGSPSGHTPSSSARPSSGMLRLAHEVVPLVVERGVEEEVVVLDLEMLVLFADAALAQGQKLLALGERAHSDSPL